MTSPGQARPQSATLPGSGEVSAAQAARAPDYAQAHGCACWPPEVSAEPDHPSTSTGRPAGTAPPGKFWASVAGLDAVEHADLSDLSRDTIWWTNLSRSRIWSLGRWRDLKPADFMGVSLNDLMEDHAQAPSPETAVLWSETLARAAGWLAESAASDGGAPWEWGDGALSDALAARWGWTAPGGQDEDPLVPVLASACHETIFSPTQRQPGDTRRISVGLPRVQHLSAMWAERVPQGRLSRIPPGIVPRLPDALLGWLREQRCPTLVRISALSFSSRAEAVGQAWLGLRGRRFQAAEPEPFWMTAEEAIVLSRWARMEVDQALQADRWMYSSPPVSWLQDAMETGLAQYSMTLGLLGLSAWRAAAMPARDPRSRRRTLATPQAVWRAAADRNECFASIEPVLSFPGASLIDYGNGRATVEIPSDMQEEQWRDLAGRLKAAGFVLPRRAALALPMDPKADCENPADFIHWMLRARPDLPWLLDRLAATWMGPAGQVHAVLDEALRALVAEPMEEVPHWRKWWKEHLRTLLESTANRLRQAHQRRSGG